MSRVVLITAQPRGPSSGATTTVRLAGGGNRKGYFYQGQHWRAGVANLPRFRVQLGFDEKGWTGGVLPTTSAFIVAPYSSAVLSELAGLVWRGAGIVVQEGREETEVFSARLTGKVADVGIQDSKLIFTIADLSHGLDKPLLSARFAGTGGLEGGAEAEGRIKRRTWGRAFNIEGRVLDKANNIYEFGDPAFAWQAFDVLRDKGREAGPAHQVIAWQGSALATLNALKASVPVQGSGVAAPSIACAKWWTQPAGPLTADVRGEIGAAYVETAPSIAARILAAANGPAIANLAAANGWRGATAGLHVDEGETAAGALDRLLLPIALLWALNPAGSIQLREFSFADPVETLRSDKAERLRTLPPVKVRRVGYRKSYRQHNDGEIAASLLQLDPAAALNLQQLASDIAELDAAVDGKVAVFFQSTAPAAEGEGDLWFKTDTSKWYRSTEAGAGSWVLTEDAGIGQAISAAAGAQATADGKVTTYYQQATPPAPANGDLWIQPSASPRIVRRWVASSSQWVEVANLVTQGADIGVANGATKNVIYRGESAPASPENGDIWVDTSVTPNITRTRVAGAWQASANLVTTGGHIGVDDGATLGDNFVRNGMFAADTRYWFLYNGTGSGTVTRQAGSAGDPSTGFIRGAGTTDGYFYTQPRAATPPSPTLFFSLRGRVSDVANCNIRVEFWWYTPQGAYLSVTTINVKPSAAGQWQLLAGAAAVPVTAGSVEMVIWPQAPSGHSTDVTAVRSGASELSADVTSGITGVGEITIEADHNGAITSGLPRNDAFKLIRNGVDVTGQAAWSRTILSGGYTGTIGASTGVLNSTGLTTREAVVRLTAVLGATTRTFDVKFRRNDAPPPTGGSGGSGTTGGTTASATSFSAISTTSMATIATLAPVTVSSAGKIKLSANLSPLAAAADPTGSFDVAGILQLNIGGTWTDVATEASSHPDTFVIYEPEMATYFSYAGTLSFAATATGLPPGSSYESRLRARNTSAAKSITFSGSAVADGTVA
jgi:hypothetical protein